MEGTFREEVAYREDFDDYELDYSEHKWKDWGSWGEMGKEGFIELYGDRGARNEGLGFFWSLLMNRDKDHNKISPSGFMAVFASL